MTADTAGLPPVITLVNPSTGARFDFRGRWLRSSSATDADVRAGRAKYRGDRVYLSIPPGVQVQLDKGMLRYASLLDEQLAGASTEMPGGHSAPGATPMPPANGSHGAWVMFAISQGMDQADAAALT